jgi:hypothetical protein
MGFKNGWKYNPQFIQIADFLNPRNYPLAAGAEFFF